MKTYFITGATGAIGACIVPMLLINEDTQVRLLIRARNPDHLNERLEKLFSFWEYPAGSSCLQRIKAYTGDVLLPFLGMSPDDYRAVTSECTHIIHSAGNVRMNLALEEARRSSVDSARSIVALANACQSNGTLHKLEFVSTVGVAGRRQGSLPESWITEKRSFHNTYEEAKAEAEVFIRSEIEKGLPATVHRPSMVVGDSKTGKIIHFQVFYHLCEFLSGRRTLGILPRMRAARLDIIPVDYVAKAIIWSSSERSAIGRIMHLCSGPEHSISIKELRNRVRSSFKTYGYRLPPSTVIPLWIFETCLPLIALTVSRQMKNAMNALPFFLDYLAEEQSFANKDTTRILESEGLGLPQIGEYLERDIRYFISSRSK
jgi:thioester reductase-like protein